MGSGSLHRGELDGSGLAAGALADELAQGTCGAGELLVAKCIDLVGGIAELAGISAVSQLQALGDCDHDGSLGLCQMINLVQELVDIEDALRQIDRIDTGAVISLCKGSCSGEPAGIAAHDLGHADGRLLGAEGLVVADDLLQGRCNVLCSGAVSGAVIGDRQIIVDGLGNAHEGLLLAMLLRIVGEHLDGVHGVIAACVEQGVNVVLLHHLEDLLVDILMSFRLGHLVAAGAQEGRGSSLQELDAHGICEILVEIHDLALQEALDAVNHAVDMNSTLLLGTDIDAGNGGIDDGCGAAGLTYYYVSHDELLLSEGF